MVDSCEESVNQELPLSRDTTRLTNLQTAQLSRFAAETQTESDSRRTARAARAPQRALNTSRLCLSAAMLPPELSKQKPSRVSEPFGGSERPQVPPLRLKNRDSSRGRRRSGSAPERRVSCVLVGDGAVGKSSLIASYTTNGYPAEYVPTALDNFTGNLQHQPSFTHTLYALWLPPARLSDLNL